MNIFQEFAREAANIKELANSVEVKGERNMTAILYIIQRCDRMLQQTSEILKQFEQNQNGSVESETPAEGSEDNGDN